MADNVTLSTSEVLRTLEDGSSIHHPVSIQVYATSVGTPDVISIPLAAALGDDTSNPTTVLYGTCLMVYDGSTWDRARGDSTDGLLVNLGANNDVTLATLPDTAAGDLAALVVDAAAIEALLTTIDADTSNLSVVGGGTEAAAVRVTIASDSTGVLSIDDNGGSLTVDAPVGTPVFVRLSDGSSAIATLPVSLASVPSHDVTNAGTFAVQAAQSGAWNITDVSGTISLPTGAATAAKQPALGTAGTASADVITVQGVASMTPLLVDGSGATQPVSNAGTFAVQVDGDALTSLQLIDDAVSGAGFNITQLAGAAVPIGAGTEDTALRVTVATDSTGVLSIDDNGGEITVDGTVTAELSATDNAVLDTIASPVATISSTPLQRIAIFDDNDTQITSFGGGTQYTEADTDASITGTAMLMEDAADTLVPAQGSVADGLLVNLGGNNDVTLATLPDTAGGDLAAINTAVSGTLTVGSHDVTNAGTFAVQAAQSGTWTVDLGATDNAVLDTIASPVATISATPLQRVAIFDAADAQITTFGGGTQYTEDAAAAADPVGTAMILVRADTLAGVTSTDGDNVATRGTDKGEVYVKHVDAIPITDNGGSITVDGTVTAELSATDNAVLDDIAAKLATIDDLVLVEDAAHNSGDSGMQMLAVRNDSGAPLAGTHGDYIPLSTDEVGALRVNLFGPGTVDSFGHVIVGSINNQIDIQWYRSDGSVGDLVTETNANGGTATATGGMATFAATTSANSSAKGVSTTSTVYTAGAEMYALFTAAFTAAGSGTSYARLGLYDTNNGFFIGYEGATFGATVRSGTSDTQTAKASWNKDTLTGAASSRFTRGGVPEAIDLTKINVWRIRFGWVGSAPIEFEVLAPDGHWVTFHQIRQPNNAVVPSIQTADLPITCNVNSGNSSTAMSILSNCWAAGTTAAQGKLDATLAESDYAQLVRSVITGWSTAGGGQFVNVKVTPSGALTVEASGTVTANLSATDNAVLDDIAAALYGAGFIEVINAGTFAVQETGTHKITLGTATYTEATSTGLAIAAVRRDADTTLVDTTNEWGPLQMDANGRLKVEVFDSGDSHTVDYATTGSGTATGALRVELANNGTGTLATVSTVTTVTTCSTVTALTGGGVAHDGVDSGNPHKIGGRAIAHGTNPTAVAAADRTDWLFNRAGVPFVMGGHPNVITHSVRVLDSDGAQSNVAMVTVGGGAKIVVTRVSCKADGSNTGPTNITVGFAAATLATPNTTTAGSGILADFLGVPAGGGAVEGNGSGILGVGADGEDLRYTCEDPVGGAVTISVTYYTIES